MKGLLIMVTLIAGCSVTSELKGLQELKAECDALELELAGLKAKKWTEVIDKKVAQCDEHGFMSGKLKKQRRKTEREELMEEF